MSARASSGWWLTLPPAALPFLVLAAPVSSPAAILHVPGDAATIQGGVDLASGGDEVVLADGVWTGPGNRDVTVGKSVIIRSASGDPAACVIDCQASGRGFTFQGLSSAARLEGVTITGGSATHGGGILFSGVSPAVEGCRILGNLATGTGGGGIAVESGAAPRLVGCMISGNSVTGTNGGAGIWNVGGSPVLINCVLAGNATAALGLVGGAMYTTQGGAPVFANCAIYGNSAYTGSGFYCSFSSSTTVVNSILWGQAGAEIVLAFSATASVTHSDVEGGWAGAGNFDSNPIFTDPGGPDAVLGNADDDLSLGRFSPCTDAGDNAAPALSGITEDLRGLPRFVDDAGVGDTGAGASPVVDVGPFERQTESVPMTFRVPTDVATIQSAVAQAGPQDEVVLEDGIHAGAGNRDVLVDREIVIRSESLDASACVVDCQGAGRGFRFVGVGPAARLEGVTVTNGMATEGGGLRLQSASPAIVGCRILSNTATGAGGGGLHCAAGSSPTLTGCVISGNVASGTYGGGLYLKDGSPVLRDCVLYGNDATGLGSTGGAIYSWTASPSLVNCSLAANDAYDGTVLYSQASSYPELLNCIVWANDPGIGGKPLVDASSSITYVAYSDIQGGATGPGNLQVDPLFLDANLRIASWSPCVDAGSGAWVTTLTDADGAPRIADGDGDGTAVVDMGAYEVPAASPTGAETITQAGGPALLPPRPNPARAGTHLSFRIERAAPVTLTVYDVTGRRVRGLAAGVFPAGQHGFTWDGTNDAGWPVAAGTYLARLTTDRGTFSRKVHRVR